MAHSAPEAATASAADRKATDKNKPNTGERGAAGGDGKARSLIDAAELVLRARNNRPTSTKDLVVQAIERELWAPRDGKTPANTLYAAILREIKTKGDASRFRKAERGKFVLKNSQAARQA